MMPSDEVGDKPAEQGAGSDESTENREDKGESAGTGEPAPDKTQDRKPGKSTGKPAAKKKKKKKKEPVTEPVKERQMPVRLARSVGMEMPSNRYRPFLGHGAIPPVREKKHFVARLKKHDSVEIVVLEGDDDRADRNVFVGELGMNKIQLREDGRAEIEVEYSLNDKGVLIIILLDRLSEKESTASFILPQYMKTMVVDSNLGGLPIEELSQKIDLLEEQMQLLKGELSVRKERE